MDNWKLEITEDYERDLKHLKKKRPKEFIAAANNLDTYLKALDNVENHLQVNGGYIHPETSGSIAIDQSGSQKILGKKLKLRETRLYLYPSDQTKTVYLLKIGDKDTQPEDNKFCQDFIHKLRGK